MKIGKYVLQFLIFNIILNLSQVISYVLQFKRFPYSTKISNLGIEKLRISPTLKLSPENDDNDRFLANSIASELGNVYINQISLIFLSLKSSNNAKVKINKTSLALWDENLFKLTSELRKFKGNKETLLSSYKSLLRLTAPLKLDPLQFASFDFISHAIIDGLLNIYPKNIAITELVDEITEVHLKFIEELSVLIDDGGSDG